LPLRERFRNIGRKKTRKGSRRGWKNFLDESVIVSLLPESGRPGQHASIIGDKLQPSQRPHQRGLYTTRFNAGEQFKKMHDLQPGVDGPTPAGFLLRRTSGFSEITL
jgi:hypothetical protein